jgi:hypothetical protein
LGHEGTEQVGVGMERPVVLDDVGTT